MPRWTEESRRKQAEKIRQWQPWSKAGVKTPEGKAVSRMNALRDGAFSAEARATRRMLHDARALLRLLKEHP